MKGATRYGGVRSTVFTRRPGEEPEPLDRRPAATGEELERIAAKLLTPDPNAGPTATAAEFFRNKLIDLHIEPVEEILVYGLMQGDARAITRELSSLPTAREGYRGGLRIIIAAARAIETRAMILLGEGPGAA